MDRKTRERCAGALTAFGVVLLSGCGANQAGSELAVRKASAPEKRPALSAPASRAPSEPAGTVIDVVHVPLASQETNDRYASPEVSALPPIQSEVDAQDAAPSGDGAASEWSALANSPYAVDESAGNMVEFVPSRELTSEPTTTAAGGGAEVKFSLDGTGSVSVQAVRPTPTSEIAPPSERPQAAAIELAKQPSVEPPVATRAVPEVAPRSAEPMVAEPQIVQPPLVASPARAARPPVVAPQAEAAPAPLAASEPARIAQNANGPTPAPPEAAPIDQPADAAAVKSDLTPLVVKPREAPPTIVLAEPPVAGPLPQAQAEPAHRQLQPQQARPAVPQVAPAPMAQSPATVAALTQAQDRVRHAIDLAGKGAYFAARKEFMTSIKMIAQANDAERRTRQHTKAAIAGFVALKESGDFVGSSVNLAELDVEQVALGHKTPVLKDIELSDMPPSIAAQYYYGYAKDQLAIAIGRETTGSIALYGLAKILVAGAGANRAQLECTGPATALYQAALLAEPQNYRAAHELGVLLASSGQLEAARTMLVTSTPATGQATAWRNLATVHARLGEQQLAAQAQQQAETLAATNPEANVPPVQWVDPATFAKTVSATDGAFPQAAPAAPAVTPVTGSNEPTMPKGKVAKKRLDEWNPLNLRR